MGISNSKSKKKKPIVIVNSNVADGNGDFTFNESEEQKPPDACENVEKSPTLKWHKANPKEEIIKIQQEAEIRDIETIYENSRIGRKDLLNLMPDHYWSGKENKLPRYVLYRGDYPNGNVETFTNLRRAKSSSLNDLTDSICFYDNKNEELTNETQSVKPIHRSISCPHFITVTTANFSKVEKDVPIKGILKNRKANRPNSAMVIDNRDDKLTSPKMTVVQLITVAETDFKNQIIDDNSSKSNHQLKFSNIKKKSGNIVNINVAAVSSSSDEDDSILSGYFDQSPNRVQDECFLRVNTDKKKWIKNNLDKRLNLRPTSVDLANRNILHEQDEYNRQTDFEQTRCLLGEKLSERPTLTELTKKKIIKFSDFVEIQETDNYDRSVAKTLGRLTEGDKETIRNELNEFKNKEMKIHVRSKKFTKFHDSCNE